MAKTISELMQTPEQKKLSYVTTQIEEMEAITLRNEVDIYINENADWEEHEREAVTAKVNELKKVNKTLSKALVALAQLKDKLEA